MTRQPPPSIIANGEEDGSYLASLSDLMVGLVFIFLIVLMAFAFSFRSAEDAASAVQEELVQERNEVAATKDQLEAQLTALAGEHEALARERDALAEERDELGAVAEYLLRNESIRNAMLVSVQNLVRERFVDVSLEPENGVLRLPESLLFDSARAELRPDGVRALRELAAVLARTLPCYSRAPAVQQADCTSPKPLLETVLIEGHTDERPIHTPEFADNWSLASARAINTYKALLEFEPSLALLRNSRGEDLIGVSSYEARRPVSDEPSEEGRRLNRRIDLRFLVAAPPHDELTAVRQRVRGGVSP